MRGQTDDDRQNGACCDREQPGRGRACLHQETAERGAGQAAAAQSLEVTPA